MEDKLDRLESDRLSEKKINYEEDEIDLYDLWLTIKRKSKMVISITVLFLILSIIFIVLSEPVYRASFIVKVPSSFISPQETKNIIGNLEKIRKENRFDELSDLLDVSENVVSKIDSMVASEVRKSKDLLKITLNVYDPGIIGNLSYKILDYLNDNRFVKERIEIKKEEILFSITETKKRIREIETIKSKILNALEKGNFNDFGFNPADLDKTVLTFKEKVKKLENQLKLLRGYEIVVEPVIPERPIKPKKDIIIALSSVSGLILGVFLAFFTEWIENARKRRKI
ncbi:Wzz/FepE/Etk N-terminal domain-containing protein [Persephonella sp.]